MLSLLDEVDATWALRRRNGMVSGEAIVHHVRDDNERTQRKEQSDGVVVETRQTIERVADKRLVLEEEELSRVLRIARKKGSTLSATIREAWDGDLLMTTAKTKPERATGAHVTTIGSITPQELRQDFSRVDLENGFANRFLFVASRRARMLIRPPRVPEEVRNGLVAALREVREHVRMQSDEESELELPEAAWESWASIRPEIEREVEAAVCKRGRLPRPAVDRSGYHASPPPPCTPTSTAKADRPRGRCGEPRVSLRDSPSWSRSVHGGPTRHPTVRHHRVSIHGRRDRIR